MNILDEGSLISNSNRVESIRFIGIHSNILHASTYETKLDSLYRIWVGKPQVDSLSLCGFLAHAGKHDISREDILL